MPDKLSFSPSVAIIVAGVVIAGAIVYVNAHPGPAAPAADAAGALPASVNVVAPSAQDHILGSPSAPIVLIEYSDFECPYCRLVYPTLKSIVEGSGGQVAWVMRNFPLNSIHPQANPAANAAECIAVQLGNDGWWQFADTVFANQDKMSAAYYRTLAGQLGADLGQYDSCVAASTYQAEIDAQAAEAQVNGGQGTPYTVVYGHGVQVPVSGAQPLANFQAVIRAVQSRQ